MPTAKPEGLLELRVLDGPNLYFTRPAIKLTLSSARWMKAPEERVLVAAVDAGLRGAARAASPGPGASGAVRPGPPGSEHRRRFLARLAAHLTRELSRATDTHLAVRARPGPEDDEIVVSYPWRGRTVAEAFGREVAALFGGTLGARTPFDRRLRDAARRLARVETGPAPRLPEPTIPVVAVTGTNGKTTTVRLLAHVMRTAGMTVAYSSTDGVYLGNEQVETGDYSGFGGAGTALSLPGVEGAVLETARGGILLRGIGTAHNDVAIVTNISADHLGLHGIYTLDQLAEVKSAILRITRTNGWDVLNADDPRVLAMRGVARGRPWLFTMDSDHPALRSVLEEHGRGITVIDGSMTLLTPGQDSRPLVKLEDVPVTLAGISRGNVQNAMAVAAAALGIGLPESDVVKGLRTFVLDPETNPGRANLFELEGRVIVVDYAHNEAGMQGLTEVCDGLRRPGAEVWLTFSTAGDRSDEIIHRLGYIAARGADHLAISELRHYLRGRDPEDLLRRQRAGAADGGVEDPPVFPDEMHSLQWMIEQSKANDVIALPSLGQRPEVFRFLEEQGATRVSPKRVRQLVRRARAGKRSG